MLFRPQAQLASSLVLGWFSACVSWCNSCLSWTVSSTPGMCVLPSPGASLGSFFCVACSAQVGFCLVWCLRLRLLVRRAHEAFNLAEGVGKLCICLRTVCLVLCCVMYFVIYQNLQCCLGLWRSWLRRLCLAGSLPVFPGATIVFPDRLFNPRYVCSPLT